MLVGHLGAGLAAKAAVPRLKLGTLFAAAMLLDLVLWVFVILGAEAATVPANYAAHHYLLFNFPYSHALLAAILWSVVAAAAWATLSRGGDVTNRLFSRAAMVLALTVFSHWLLDLLVHPSQLPLAPGAPALGFDLWDKQPLALIVELAIAAVGLVLYLLREGFAGVRCWGLIALVMAAAAMTAWGATSPTPPPAISTLAYVSLVMIAVIVAVGAWADRAKA